MSQPTPNTETSAPEKTRRQYRPVSEQAKQKYLELISQGYSHTAASQATGHDSRTWRLVRSKDETFRERVAEAVKDGDEWWEDQLRNAAANGQIAAIIFGLKNRMPHRWKDRWEVTGIPAADVQRLVERLAARVPESERAQLLDDLEDISKQSEKAKR